MLDTNNQNPNTEWTPHPNLLPFMFNEGELNELGINQDKKEAEEKIKMFEAGLNYELNETDSIDESMEKIVRVALASEYGVSMVKEAGFKRMVASIARSIAQDPVLRKQALIIADRFSQKQKKNRTQLEPPN